MLKFAGLLLFSRCHQRASMLAAVFVSFLIILAYTAYYVGACVFRISCASNAMVSLLDAREKLSSLANVIWCCYLHRHNKSSLCRIPRAPPQRWVYEQHNHSRHSKLYWLLLCLMHSHQQKYRPPLRSFALFLPLCASHGSRRWCCMARDLSFRFFLCCWLFIADLFRITYRYHCHNHNQFDITCLQLS